MSAKQRVKPVSIPYHVKETHWILEVGVLLGVGDNRRLDNMSAQSISTWGRSTVVRLIPLHLPYTPEQHLYTVFPHYRSDPHRHWGNRTIRCVDGFNLGREEAHAIWQLRKTIANWNTNIHLPTQNATALGFGKNLDKTVNSSQNYSITYSN